MTQEQMDAAAREITDNHEQHVENITQAELEELLNECKQRG